MTTEIFNLRITCRDDAVVIENTDTIGPNGRTHPRSYDAAALARVIEALTDAQRHLAHTNPTPPTDEEFARHTCTPDGRALPFGRKAPEGECRRCDQLRAGAAPRDAHPAIKAANNKRQQEAADLAGMHRHFTSGEHLDKCQHGNPTAPTTCYDW